MKKPSRGGKPAPSQKAPRAGLNYERHDVSHHHRADPSRLRFLADVSKVQGEPARGSRRSPRSINLSDGCSSGGLTVQRPPIFCPAAGLERRQSGAFDPSPRAPVLLSSLLFAATRRLFLRKLSYNCGLPKISKCLSRCVPRGAAKQFL